MKSYELSQLVREGAVSGRLYYEFLREPALSMGVYMLPAGGVDPQQPHREDEVYVVLEGEGVITVGEEQRPVNRGSVVFVGRGVAHRFHDIREALTIVVFFAPAES